MSKIIRFNTDRKPWFYFKNISEAEADLYLYNEISLWDRTAEEFTSRLVQLEVDRINLHINSPGGSIFEGLAIYTALKNHKAKVAVYVDGLAASIASVIAMAGDTIEIAGNAKMMIHKPTTIVWGQAGDLRKEADVLDEIEDSSLIETYVARTGQTREQIQEWINEETWFNADQAVEHGFADTKGELKRAAASLTRWDLSLFDHPPEEDPEDSTEKVTPLSLLIRRQALIEKTINKGS